MKLGAKVTTLMRVVSYFLARLYIVYFNICVKTRTMNMYTTIFSFNTNKYFICFFVLLVFVFIFFMFVCCYYSLGQVLLLISVSLQQQPPPPPPIQRPRPRWRNHYASRDMRSTATLGLSPSVHTQPTSRHRFRQESVRSWPQINNPRPLATPDPKPSPLPPPKPTILTQFWHSSIIHWFVQMLNRPQWRRTDAVSLSCAVGVSVSHQITIYYQRTKHNHVFVQQEKNTLQRT